MREVGVGLSRQKKPKLGARLSPLHTPWLPIPLALSPIPELGGGGSSRSWTSCLTQGSRIRGRCPGGGGRGRDCPAWCQG